jgi:HlyD family secretion protein
MNRKKEITAGKVLTLSFLIGISVMLLSCGGRRNGRAYTGIIEGRTYSVSAPVSEKLLRLDVREGDIVTDGQPVGQLDDSALELQLLILQAKKEQMDYQYQGNLLDLNQARESAAHFRDKYNRYESLYEQQAVSEQVVQDLKLQADQRETQVSGLELEQQVLESRRLELDYSIQDLENTLDRIALTAPAPGYVEKIYFEEGEMVPVLRPVMDIVNLNDVWCVIYVSEETLLDLAPSASVVCETAGRTFSGRVSRIGSEAEFTPREVLTPENRQALSYPVEIRIDNPEGLLKIGMPIDVFLDR